MSPKALVGLLVVILTLNSFVVLNDFETCRAAVLPKFYVDDNYDSATPGWQIDHFDSINDAINASGAGDRIIVYAGTYYETLNISHRLDIFGEDRDITVIDGNSDGDVITINAQNVNISHFTIRESGNTNSLIKINSGKAIITDNKLTIGKHAITVDNCDYCIIYDNVIDSNSGTGIKLNNSDYNEIIYNTITDNQNGVFLYTSDYNVIENNSAIKNNDLNGIFLNATSDYNSIKNNNISSNTQNGIFLNDHCDDNNISSNDIYSNSDSGIRIENSSSNSLYSNTVNSNENYGVMIVGSNNNILESTINYNSEHGIFLFADDYTTVYNNLIKGNTKNGVHSYNSTNNTIYTNEIVSNSQYGIYLDYFTLKNLIYNNYIHHNTNNADDKSLNRNTWNITKTSGTNKVGGSYLCGNYWDDFDESSEGVTDPNDDGVSNAAYTIHASNIDYGPLLDVTSPSISSVSASPSTQKIGSNTYISATATDNIEIKQVYLHITYPNGVVSNFSIKENKTGNTYYCSKKYSPAGSYSYHIAVKDPRNWVSSTTKTFIIDQGTAPTITDNSPTTGEANKGFVFNATVVDDTDSASQLTVKVVWSHGGESGNYTMVNVGEDFFKMGITLQKSISSLTYKIYASDQFGNSRITEQKTVSITDTEAPKIVIEEREYSSDGVQNTFTIGTTITDNHRVESAAIEYWYGDISPKTADMDKTDDYYEKVIQIEPNVNKVYCIISATDPSGNTNNTNNPYANASGPYSGVTKVDVTFNGSNSFDLDGEIETYDWDFGDGTTGSGAITTHSYSTNGNYIISLIVTDDDGNTDTDITCANIIQTQRVFTSNSTLNEIEDTYSIELTDLFYCYDLDGDSIPDKFVDQNSILKAVHEGSINTSNNTCFLISIDDGTIPEFIWNTTTDEFISITHKIGTLEGEVEIDTLDSIATQEVSVNKTGGWIYLEVSDPDIGEYGKISDIKNVTRNNTKEIDSDKIIRKNYKTYVLDDPVTNYQFRYSFQPPVLKSVVITPESGSTIDENNKTITFTYNVQVTVIDAAFYMIDPVTTLPLYNGTNIDIKNQLITSDNKEFIYIPPDNLEEGFYEIYIFVRQKDASKTMDSYARYNYIPYAEGEIQISISTILTMLGGIIIIFAAIYVIFRYKNINLESFVYIKNKKIMPFFKPVVFGPLSIDVNDEKISKAEFYLNGELKDTITQEPYIWKLDEPMFTRQKIETKIYDQDGNSRSSGEITFFIFNPPRVFK